MDSLGNDVWTYLFEQPPPTLPINLEWREHPVLRAIEIKSFRSQEHYEKLIEKVKADITDIEAKREGVGVESYDEYSKRILTDVAEGAGLTFEQFVERFHSPANYPIDRIDPAGD